MCEMKCEELINAVKDAEYFLLDMDGTVYVEDDPIGDMPATLNFLRERGKKIVYLTNNSSRNKEEYVEKLKKLNLFCDGDFIYSSGVATAEYLSEKYPDKTVYLLGTENLAREFEAHGIKIVKDRQPDIAVLAYDTELTYKKLCEFTRAVKLGSYYVATHPDINCPAKDVYVPDAGSFIKLVEASTGLRPVEIVGKPYPIMGVNLQKKYGASKNRFMMIGDRLNTDILFGKNCGFYTLLVLSGETTLGMLENSRVKPDFTLNNLNDIVKYFKF